LRENIATRRRFLLKPRKEFLLGMHLEVEFAHDQGLARLVVAPARRPDTAWISP
jgi:hypothetical protein